MIHTITNPGVNQDRLIRVIHSYHTHKEKIKENKKKIIKVAGEMMCACMCYTFHHYHDA